VLYADQVQPANVSMNGGQIAITGMGFRAGNEVLVNGVSAAVSSWTASTIMAVAPPSSAFNMPPGGAVDIEVIDLSTHGTTVMSGALTYSNVAPDVMTLVSAPSGTVYVGTPAPVAFAVRVFLGDGVTPVVGLPVSFSAIAGTVQFGACTALPCTVTTDATGLASTSVTPTAFGAVTVQAAAVGASQTASFNAVTRSLTVSPAVEYLAAGQTVSWTPQAALMENAAPAGGVPVNWTAAAGMTVAPAQSSTSAQGMAQTIATAGPLSAGSQVTGQACAWTTATAACASFAAVGVDPSAWRLSVVSGAGQALTGAGALTATFAPVVLEVTDGAGHPVAGAAVSVYQTVDAAEMPCPGHGRCPVAPVLGSARSAAVSDANGLITVAPMQIAGVAEVTNVAAATGTQGFLSLSIEQGP